MNNRIDECFRKLKSENRTALIPFITAGDPRPEWTVPVMHSLVENGANLLELGVPFSDPMADGPVIQEASERAIARGVSLRSVLGYTREFRERDHKTPVVLMGYMNPLERYGYAKFAQDAAAAGVDGIIVVDCPPEEMGEFSALLAKQGIHPINLVAPTTTPERIGLIARQASGFLYYVSFKGTTGADHLDQAGIMNPLEKIRSHTQLPVAVGFGIKNAEVAATVAQVADAVVIGSALVQKLAQAATGEEALSAASAFLAPVRKAMDNGRG